MSTNPIDSANGGALETAEAPAKGKASARPRRKAGEEAGWHRESRPCKKEGGSDRHDEAPQRRDVGRKS
jgi:hypothetical protein